MPYMQAGAETPNQKEKQQQIIDAARVVLAREGLGGCTARAIADAGPLTKSAVHYYFRDVEEIIDRAMSAHLDELVRQLRDAADAQPDPAERLWTVIDAYLAIFASNPHAARLWFEYWATLSRRDATGPVRSQTEKVRGLLETLLADAGLPGTAADGILSWLLGAVVQENIAPLARHERRRALQHLLACASSPAAGPPEPE